MDKAKLSEAQVQFQEALLGELKKIPQHERNRVLITAQRFVYRIQSFSVKYNKSGTNLQGKLNTIIRSSGRVYQIKGNMMSQLSVTGINAVFDGRANITDITDPLNPISADGNATIRLEMTDNGQPGNADVLGITVWDKNNNVWFSSNWNGTTTIKQVLGGGNLIVH